MKIIEYFSTDNKEYWLSKIKESDWNAGKRLYELLKSKKLKEFVGENTKVLMVLILLVEYHLYPQVYNKISTLPHVPT